MVEIVKYPDIVLSKKSEEITDFGQDLKDLIKNLKIGLEEEKGSGLAAIQIGVSKDIFLARDKKQEKPLVFVNPKILEYSKETSFYEEGCLSFPGVYINVKRPVSIVLKYQDEKGQSFTKTFDNFLARVIQHEYDHLQGKMFFENISKIRQKFILKEFEKLERI